MAVQKWAPVVRLLTAVALLVGIGWEIAGTVPGWYRAAFVVLLLAYLWLWFGQRGQRETR